MKEERDRFITEYMGQCWHDYDIDKPINTYSLEAYICKKCKGFILGNNDFTTEEDFQRLWIWAKEQKNMADIVAKFDEASFKGSEAGINNRDMFADAVYTRLKDRK
ncbi:MAG TPA: hypothetical protein PK864_08585 [Syntrophorhabdaceae bacterium]|nr:hypothetical protein [Syntrophorhabdaceae bacterium]HOL06052.1 hypothetical protein [Syntrophorhabdaceae bacterium]HON86068.1 hypothetical protein [Syntrophorhabdaceae bacterium]HOT42053.1 hypothetical protein [Syntrophorhabdaceae bacterium]HPC66777.1 hypothetical protein [Syntrophorhabdaceae bacterium]